MPRLRLSQNFSFPFLIHSSSFLFIIKKGPPNNNSSDFFFNGILLYLKSLQYENTFRISEKILVGSYGPPKIIKKLDFCKHFNLFSRDEATKILFHFNPSRRLRPECRPISGYRHSPPPRLSH